MGSIKTISIIVAANIKGLELGLGKANKSLANFASGAARMGSMLSFGVTAPLVALGRTAVNTFVEFEDSMMRVNVVTNATVKEFDKLTKEAKRLGSTTRFTATQFAKLQLSLGRKGFDPSEIIAMEEAIAKLALATGEDLTLAADVVGSSIRAFNRDAEDAASISNTLALAASSSSIQLSTFSTAFGHAGASANAVGVEVEELAAMMGVLMDNGIKASKAGTGLRKIFSKLHEEGRSFSEVLDLATQGEIGLEKAMKIAGLTAGGQLLILANNKTKVAELTAEYIANTTALDGMSNKMGGTAKDALATMYSSIEAMNIVLGELLVEMLTPLIEKVTELAREFTSLDEETQKMIVYVGAAAASLGVFLLAIAAIVTIGGALATAFGFVAPVVASIGTFILSIEAATVGAGLLLASFLSLIGTADDLEKKINTTTTQLKDFMTSSWDEHNSLTEIQKGMLAAIKAAKELEKVKVKPIVPPSGGWFDLSEAELSEPFNELQGFADQFGGVSVDVELNLPTEVIETMGDKISSRMEGMAGKVLKFTDTWGAGIEQVGAIFSQVYKNKGIAIDNDHNKQMEAIKNSSMSEEQKETAMQTLNKETAKKKLDLKRKQAKVDKAMAIFNIINATAVAIMQAGNPFAAVAMGILGAVQIGVVQSQPVPAFAQGGLVTGATMGLVGEGRGTTMSNPEVIAPLDKLKSMLGDSGGGGTVIPDVRITGDDLLIVFDRANRRKERR